MDLKLLIDILEQAFDLGMRSLKLTGGEPLLYDSFSGLLSYLKKKNNKLYLYMETNGTLIDKYLARTVKEAGMRFVSISIDGDNPDTHDSIRGVEGSFDKARRAAKFLIEEAIPVQIITSVYRGNAGQLENIAKMAQDLKAESLKVNIITTIGRGTVMSEHGELLSIEEMIELNRRIERDYRNKFKIRLCSSMPLAFKPSRALLDERPRFCAIKGLLGILATGKVSICGIGEEVPELVLGDAKKDRLKDIWENDPILWKIRNDIPEKLEGVCGMCIFKRHCLGHCVAHSYHDTHSFTSSFWICQKAYDQGLFPKSRLMENPVQCPPIS